MPEITSQDLLAPISTEQPNITSADLLGQPEISSSELLAQPPAALSEAIPADHLKFAAKMATNASNPENLFGTQDAEDRGLTQKVGKMILKGGIAYAEWLHAGFGFVKDTAANIYHHPIRSAYELSGTETVQKVLSGDEQTWDDVFNMPKEIMKLDPNQDVPQDLNTEYWHRTTNIAADMYILGSLAKLGLKSAMKIVPDMWEEKEATSELIKNVKKRAVNVSDPVHQTAFEATAYDPAPDITEKFNIRDLLESHMQKEVFPSQLEGFPAYKEVPIKQEPTPILTKPITGVIEPGIQQSLFEKGQMNIPFDYEMPGLYKTPEKRPTVKVETGKTAFQPTIRGQYPSQIGKKITEALQNPQETLGYLNASLPKQKPLEQVAKNALDSMELQEPNFDGFATTPTEWDKTKSLMKKAMVSTMQVLLSSKNKELGYNLAKNMKEFVDVPVKRLGDLMQDLYAQGINKLTQAEQKNLVEHINSFKYGTDVTASTDRVSAIAKTLEAHNNALMDEARSLDLPVAPVSELSWPHELIDKEKIDQLNHRQFLLRSKQAATEGEANIMVDKYVQNYSKGMSPLERERTIHITNYDDFKKLGYDVNPETAWASHYLPILRRIEEAKQFGINGSTLLPKLSELALTDPTASDIGKSLYMRLTNREPQDYAAKWFINKMTTFTYLQTAASIAYTHIAASKNIFVKTGFKNAISGLYRTLSDIVTKEDQEVLRRTGVTIENIFSDYMQAGMDSRASRLYSKLNGITPLMNFQRKWTALAGEQWLGDIEKRILANPEDKIANQELKELFIDPKKVVAENGINQFDKEVAMKRISDTTVGRTRPTELPHFWSSPYGKQVTMYHKLAFVNTKFLKDEFKKYPISTAYRTIAATIPTSWILWRVRTAISGQDPGEGIDQLINRIALQQTLGTIYETWHGLTASKERAFGTALGAPATVPVSMLYIHTKYLQDWANGDATDAEFQNMMRNGLPGQTLRMIPYGLGQRILDEIFPPQTK